MPIQTSYPTEPGAAYAGDLVRNGVSRPMFNAEAATSMPFGIAVAFKASSGGQEAVLPGALAIAGIVIRDLSHMAAIGLTDGTTLGDLDATGLKVGAAMDVLQEGEIWAICVDGCDAGDPLHVVKADGTLRASADSTNTVDKSANGTWQSQAGAGEKARLKVKF